MSDEAAAENVVAINHQSPVPAVRQQVPAIYDYQPRNLTEAMELAKMLADADMVPESYRGKPGNVILAMQMGAELGLKAMQALQNIAVIGKRPAVWGDAMLALVKASPVYEYVKEEATDRGAICRAKRRGEAEHVSVFTVEDAQKAGLLGKAGPWTQYPKRMMQMRARAFALRDVFPDVLRGMPIAEELRDYVDVTAQGSATVGASTGAAVEGVLEPKGKPAYAKEDFDKNLPAWRALIDGGKRDADAIIATVQSKYTLTEEQIKAIKADPAKSEPQPEEVQ